MKSDDKFSSGMELDMAGEVAPVKAAPQSRSRPSGAARESAGMKGNGGHGKVPKPLPEISAVARRLAAVRQIAQSRLPGLGASVKAAAGKVRDTAATGALTPVLRQFGWVEPVLMLAGSLAAVGVMSWAYGYDIEMMFPVQRWVFPATGVIGVVTGYALRWMYARFCGRLESGKVGRVGAHKAPAAAEVLKQKGQPAFSDSGLWEPTQFVALADSPARVVDNGGPRD